MNEQQINELKQFLQKYGPLITIVLIFIRLYNQNKLNKLLKRIEQKLEG